VIGRQDRWQEDLFVVGSLRDLIPEDHVLRRVDRVLDLSWLRDDVKDCYCQDNGRPGIDPESAVRLMLAGFFQGIVHDRKLMREAEVNLAIRWFAGYRLHDKLPDHSSLTRIRQRWGAERFKRLFQRTVNACVNAGLVQGDIVHIDATLIRANVSWDSLVKMHTTDVWRGNTAEVKRAKSVFSCDRFEEEGKTKKGKRRSKTDPDSTLATSNRNSKPEPCYKQHTAVDDLAGVVVDVVATTGEVNEGDEILGQVSRIESNTGEKIEIVTADAGYAY